MARMAMAQEAARKSVELHVAAAADLSPVMPILADLYGKKTGVKLVVSTGSSGSLTTQIINGAPFDLFLGADFTFPEKLVAAGLADATAPTAYAQGTLVLFARKDSPIQPLSLEMLTDRRVERVAIADKEHAPYGRAAVAALGSLKLLERVQPHLVVAENVVQAGQFVESGNAQMGLISLTLATSQHYRDIGTYVVVPELYPKIRQCAVIMKASPRRAEAHAFMEWLLSSEIQGQMQNVGLKSVR